MLMHAHHQQAGGHVEVHGGASCRGVHAQLQLGCPAAQLTATAADWQARALWLGYSDGTICRNSLLTDQVRVCKDWAPEVARGRPREAGSGVGGA